jgi:hypothetical protein
MGERKRRHFEKLNRIAQRIREIEGVLSSHFVSAFTEKRYWAISLACEKPPALKRGYGDDQAGRQLTTFGCFAKAG